MVKYAYTGNGWITLRLYSNGSAKLLAERSYLYVNEIKLSWFDDKLVYDTSESSMFNYGAISLPPTVLDGLLARLP